MIYKAIPQIYNGVKFRSTVEARYAVFLDMLGTPWMYEYQGFDLPSCKYLPDFWLPKIWKGLFIEVKSCMPTEKELTKCNELSRQIDSAVALQYEFHHPENCEEYGLLVWNSLGLDSFPKGLRYVWTECSHCRYLTLVMSHAFSEDVETDTSESCHCKQGYLNKNSVTITNAYNKARGFRFWNPKSHYSNADTL